MLGKLFKHEMKATARLLLPIYLVLAVLTIMDRIVIYLDIFTGYLEVIPALITIAYVISIIAVFVVSYVIIILRFYKNLLTDEGYLMFTLPVKTHEIINSKLLVSLIWNIASILGVFASLFILFSGSKEFTNLPQYWAQFMDELNLAFGSGLALFIVELIVGGLLSIINGILMIYVSIALGQFFNGHKVLGSFASYIGISIVVQIITTMATIFIGLAFQKSFGEITSLSEIVFPFTIGFVLILSGVYYWLTNFIFNRKLNLD